MPLDQLGQTQVQGHGAWKEQAGVGHQAVVVEGDLDAIGVLLVSGRFPLSKTIIPYAKEHFLTPSPRRDAHLFRGLGL